MSVAREGRILPRGAALASWRDGELLLLDAASGEVLRAGGRFAEELTRWLSRGERGPALAAAGEGAAGAWLARLAGEPALPLSAASALALEGFETLFLELTARCNQRCVHCYASASPEASAHLDRARCEALLDEARELGFERVQLTGGEPLLHEDVVALAARAGERGLACELYTNGLLLEGALLDELAALRPAFAFSFYSHRAEVHDAITRTPGSQRRTLAAIEAVLARGLPARAAIVVMRENEGDLAATQALLSGLGLAAVGVGWSAAVGRGELFEGALPPARASEPPDASVPPDAPPAPPGMERRRGRLAVAADGAVYPCIFNRRDQLGSVAGGRSLRAILAAPALPAGQDPAARLAQARRALPCLDCRLTACALAALGEAAR